MCVFNYRYSSVSGNKVATTNYHSWFGWLDCAKTFVLIDKTFICLVTSRQQRFNVGMKIIQCFSLINSTRNKLSDLVIYKYN